MRLNNLIDLMLNDTVVSLNLTYRDYSEKVVLMDLGLYISLWLCVGIAVGFIISKMS